MGIAFMASMDLDSHRHDERKYLHRTREKGSGAAGPRWQSFTSLGKQSEGASPPELLRTVHVPFQTLQTLTFINRSCGATPKGEAMSPGPPTVACKTEVYAYSYTFLPFFSFSHICVLFSLISNVSQHIMFSEVFKAD